MERFIRRCAAHGRELDEREEGYRQDGQSRESGLWCSVPLSSKSSGHWVTRWEVFDRGQLATEDKPAIKGQGTVAYASPDFSHSGEYAELDEDFFAPMIEVMAAGSSVFARLITTDDDADERVSETRLANVHVTPQLPRNGSILAASMSMADAHGAVQRILAGMVLTPVQDEAMRLLGECTAIAWCPRERKRPYRSPTGYQLELCWADSSLGDEWQEAHG